MSLRAALLGLLSEGPATGYELIREFDVSTSVVWPAPKSEVYRELAKLEAEGFAKPGKESGARRRREWHITPKGRAQLKQWLTADADYTFRYEPILRAVFLGALSPAEIRARVAADRAFFESELAALQPQSARTRARRRYSVPMAAKFYEAMLSWCDEAERIARK